MATDDSIMRRMRVECWIAKVRNTLRICNTSSFFTRTRLSATLYVRRLSLHIQDSEGKI